MQNCGCKSTHSYWNRQVFLRFLPRILSIFGFSNFLYFYLLESIYCFFTYLSAHHSREYNQKRIH